MLWSVPWCGTVRCMGVCGGVQRDYDMVWDIVVTVHVYSCVLLGGTCVVVVAVWRFHGSWCELGGS